MWRQRDATFWRPQWCQVVWQLSDQVQWRNVTLAVIPRAMWMFRVGPCRGFKSQKVERNIFIKFGFFCEMTARISQQWSDSVCVWRETSGVETRLLLSLKNLLIKAQFKTFNTMWTCSELQVYRTLVLVASCSCSSLCMLETLSHCVSAPVHSAAVASRHSTERLNIWVKTFYVSLICLWRKDPASLRWHLHLAL